jgi:hypothetical protein
MSGKSNASALHNSSSDHKRNGSVDEQSTTYKETKRATAGHVRVVGVEDDKVEDVGGSLGVLRTQDVDVAQG